MVEELLRATPADERAGRRASRLRRPWWSRLSRTQAVALIAALLAGALNVAALRRADAESAVLVAATDLGAGAMLDEASVTAAALAGPDALLGTLVPADMLGERAGWLLTRPLSAGEPLRWTDLQDPRDGAGQRLMSLPVEPEHAAAGSVRPGDRIDVIGVREGQAFWVLGDVEVVDVSGGEDSGALGAPATYALVLRLSEQQAIRLAWALHESAVEVVRATGAPALADSGAIVGAPQPDQPGEGGEPVEETP